MKPTAQEVMNMLGYAALEIRSYEPTNSKRRRNCWCVLPWGDGDHEAGCKLMREAMKAWKDHKMVG